MKLARSRQGVPGVRCSLGGGSSKGATEAHQDRAITVPIRVSNKNGDPVITLDAATQQRSGIEAGRAAVNASSRGASRLRDGPRCCATSTELRNNYANAKAQVQTAQAKLAMSKPAFGARKA